MHHITLTSNGTLLLSIACLNFTDEQFQLFCAKLPKLGDEPSIVGHLDCCLCLDIELKLDSVLGRVPSPAIERAKTICTIMFDCQYRDGCMQHGDQARPFPMPYPLLAGELLSNASLRFPLIWSIVTILAIFIQYWSSS
jgi:hypothetical protein